MNSCDHPILPTSLMSWRIDRELPLNVEDSLLCTEDVLVWCPLHRPEGTDQKAEFQILHIKDANVKNVARAIYDYYQTPITQDDLAILQKYKSSEQQYQELRRVVMSDNKTTKRYQLLPQRYRTFGGLVPIVEDKNGRKMYILAQ